MTRTVIDREYRKIAPSGGEQQLGHEARMLGAIRHPGVVALLSEAGDHPDELSLGFLPGGNLDGRRFPAPEVAGIGAAVATTLADLHDSGVVYNGCSTSHILLGHDGAPVLCSFGRAEFGLEQRELAAAQRNDVQALTAVLVAILDDDGGSLRRQLQRSGRRRQPSARSLARLLAAVTDARLPSPDLEDAAHHNPPAVVELAPLAVCPPDKEEAPSLPDLVGGHRKLPSRLQCMFLRSRFLIAAAAAALVLTGVVLATQTMGGRARSTTLAANCPSVDAGCHPVTTANGVLSTPAGQWSLGESGDIVVLGRWSCTPIALPALLAPATGQLWVFDRWALPGSDVAARPLARIPGATSLVVLPGSNGCDRLQAIGPAGRRRTLDPGSNL